VAVNPRLTLSKMSIKLSECYLGDEYDRSGVELNFIEITSKCVTCN